MPDVYFVFFLPWVKFFPIHWDVFVSIPNTANGKVTIAVSVPCVSVQMERCCFQLVEQSNYGFWRPKKSTEWVNQINCKHNSHPRRKAEVWVLVYCFKNAQWLFSSLSKYSRISRQGLASRSHLLILNRLDVFPVHALEDWIEQGRGIWISYSTMQWL